jgi:hypothetical protein
MTNLDVRPVRRETRAMDPIKHRKVLIVRLEVGGKFLAIKLKGERRWLKLTYEEIYRTAFRVAAYEAKRQRDEEKAQKRKRS